MSEYKNLELKELNYNSYLKVPELLSLQQLLSKPAHHDEMFFIVIHQAAELWFKEILHETEALVHALQEGSVSRAIKVLRRTTAIMDLLIKQFNLLSTLTPVEFAGFRENLRPASGFQSLQFRILEYAYGLKDPFFLNFFKNDEKAIKTLKKYLEAPSVYDQFIYCLKDAGYKIPQTLLKRDVKDWRQKPNADLVSLIKEIYENPKDNFHWVLLFETMLDFDEKYAHWRSLHLLMVARTIGQKPGTGGSTGYKFLQSRLEYRFFPELWEIRTHIGPNY